MATILADDFNRVGATLGAAWSEPLGNFSTDGATAVIDATGLSVATVNGSTQTDQFVQCFLQVPDAAQNCGVVWRYQSTTLYYLAFATQTAMHIFRRDGGGFNLIATRASGIGVGGWHRLAVRMVGTQIDLYFDQNYSLMLEGPVMRIADGGIVGGGLCGIVSTGNNLTGAAGPLWDGFHCFDATPDTIYVDVAATIPTLGTEADPDPGIAWGLNAAGLDWGDTLQILTDGGTPIGNGGSAQEYSIGHAGKFSALGGESFPEYSDEDGTETAAGAPNLVIKGSPTGPTTILRETQNRSFFLVRETATFVQLLGLFFDATGGVGSKLIQTSALNNLGAGTERSIAVDKTTIQLATAAANGTTGILIGTDCDVFRSRYLEGTVRAGRFGSSWFQFDVGHTINDVQIRRAVLNGPVRQGILFAGGPPIGELWDVDHVTYVDLNLAVNTVSCVQVADGALVAGTIEHQNCIMATRGADPVEFGTRVVLNSGAIPGAVEAHHNGYFGLGTNRGAGVTDTGDEIDNLDPDFIDEATAFTWTQSAASPAIVLPSDWRPGDVAYIGTADDVFAGVALDRGALQVFGAVPPTPVPPPDGEIGRLRPDLCLQLIFDPFGISMDLSDRLLSMRPITQQKDVLQRRYKISDTAFEIIDSEGLFVEGSALSVMEDDAGESDWYGKEVLARLFDTRTNSVFDYLGFLIGVDAGRGKSALRVGNRFQQLFRTELLANATGKLVSTTNVNGTPEVPPIAGSYLAALGINAAAKCKIENWTFTFLNATQFDVMGSVTGDDGSGDTGTDFTSDSGAITALSADWTGVIVAGAKIQARSIFRHTATTTVAAFSELITSAQAANLPASIVDSSVPDLLGSPVDQFLSNGLVADKDGTTVIAQLEIVSLHMLGVAFEKTNGDIGLYAYVPLLSGRDIDVLCKHIDLMTLSIDHMPIYNEFRFEYGYDQTTGTFDLGVTVPPSNATNTSIDKYGQKLPAPNVFQLKGFTFSERSWIVSMGEQNFARYGDPRIKAKVALKSSRLGMELDDLFRIDSEAPTIGPELFVEPGTITKAITPNPHVTAEMFDISFYLQFEGDCGFMFHDANHLHDDCWVHF